MQEVEKVLSTLYNAIDSPESSSSHISDAVTLLVDIVADIDSPMLSHELSDIVNLLISDDCDIDSVIYELEVINNER